MSDTIEPMITGSQDAKIDDEQAAGEAAVPAPVLDAAGQQRLAEQLVAQARAQGVDLASADELLAQLTKRVLETALEAEMVEHLGYEARQAWVAVLVDLPD